MLVYLRGGWREFMAIDALPAWRVAMRLTAPSPSPVLYPRSGREGCMTEM